jgi:hypothetical protein
VLLVGASHLGTDVLFDISPVADSVHLVYHRNPVQYTLPPNSEQHPPIVNIDRDGAVTFENGVSCTVDSIVLCTGYQYSYPFLTDDCGVQVSESGKQVFPLYKHLFNATHPSMAFPGVLYPILALPFFHVQIQYLLSVFAGKTPLPLPEVMAKECIQNVLRKMEKGVGPSHSHREDDMLPYIEELVSLASLEPYPRVNESLGQYLAKQREHDPLNYRKYNYVIYENDCGETVFNKYLCDGETLE